MGRKMRLSRCASAVEEERRAGHASYNLVVPYRRINGKMSVRNANSSRPGSEAGFAQAPGSRFNAIKPGDAPGARGLGIQPVDITDLPGRLIVVEGTDGVGRSTQVALLREWLENRGFGVAHTALTRSRLAGEGLRRAKEGHTLGRLTMDLFYATDLADRVENQIIPALRAGFVVLADRYIFSVMARSIVRGVDPAWIRDVYRFAPIPHAVFYLKADLAHLSARVQCMMSLAGVMGYPA